MHGLKDYIKTSSVTKPIYEKYLIGKKEMIRNRKLCFHGNFINRSKGRRILCVVLAGYKPYLYNYVFRRIKAYLEESIDVCVVTSGLHSDEIDKICEKNQWSYLETKENNVCLVQNVAINMHPNAQFIFKLDEDIFITENYFKNMMVAYKHASAGYYKPGIIAPLIPINGYGYARVLEKLNLVEEYERRFGRIRIAASSPSEGKAPIEDSLEHARFFWGEDGIVPSIDEINRIFQSEPQKELPCAIRFSIGAILFERSFWEDIGLFDVNLKKNSMGVDEKQICGCCCLYSRPIMVSENIVVGHFSFGSQTEGMKKYLLEHPEKFSNVS